MEYMDRFAPRSGHSRIWKIQAFAQIYQASLSLPTQIVPFEM
jgi:hypothetical protein